MTVANITKWTQLLVSIVGLLGSAGVIHLARSPETEVEVVHGISLAAVVLTSALALLNAIKGLFPKESN